MTRRPFAGLATVGSVAMGLLAAAALASSTGSTSGWSITPTPNPTARTGQLLFGTCTDASSCIAVGTYVTDSKRGETLVERYNGAKWSSQASPNPAWATVSVLGGVACSRRSACVAVGDALKPSGAQLTLIERFNGHRWQIDPTPNPERAQQNFLIAVACSSPSSCIAVGGYVTRSGKQLNLSERWNGHAWKLLATPTPSRAHFTFLDGVSCTGPSACTAVGATDRGALAERWNGRSWRIQATPGPKQGGANLDGVVCTSSSSCTAVGGSNEGTLAERWNGTSWKLQRIPSPAGEQFGFLNSVDCSSPSGCTAVGAYAPGNAGDVRTLAERWNGHRWTIQRTPSPGGAQGDFLLGVRCPSASSCAAFGFSHGSGTPRPMAQRWNGHRWALEGTVDPKGAAESALTGVACFGASSCLAVGIGGQAAFAVRRSGASWKAQRIPSVRGAFLNALACPSRSACFAVGSSTSGTIAERWDGTRWRLQHIPSPAGADMSGLGGVSCTSAAFCLAAGAFPTTSDPNGPIRGFAERWDGKRWTILSLPNPPGAVQTFLGGVSCTSPSACTVTGEQHFADGTVHTLAERWNGSAWTIQPTPNPSGAQFASLPAVACAGPSACIAVGGSDAGGPLAERWDGSKWSIQRTPNVSIGGAGFTSVSCATPAACTAIGFGFTGLGGVILAERWNGSRWSYQPTPLLAGAHDISTPAVDCPTRTACTVVGGYENDGPTSVTLALQWHGRRTGGHIASAAADGRGLGSGFPAYRRWRGLARPAYRTQSWSSNSVQKGWN